MEWGTVVLIPLWEESVKPESLKNYTNTFVFSWGTLRCTSAPRARLSTLSSVFVLGKAFILAKLNYHIFILFSRSFEGKLLVVFDQLERCLFKSVVNSLCCCCRYLLRPSTLVYFFPTKEGAVISAGTPPCSQVPLSDGVKEISLFNSRLLVWDCPDIPPCCISLSF